MGRKILIFALVLVACLLIYIAIFKTDKEKYTTLSILTRVYPKTRETNYNIENIIRDQKNYIFCKDDSIDYRKFSNMTISDLANFLIKKNEFFRLMITPSGIVDWYDIRVTDVMVDKKVGKIWGKKKNSSEKPFELKQYQDDKTNLDIDTYLKKQGDYIVSPDEKYYLRTLLSDPNNYRDLIPSFIPIDKKIISNVSFYISGKGIITNLHVDIRSGIIVQLRGRKRVYVFPKEVTKFFDMYPNNHPLARRSRIDGILNEEVIAQNLQIRDVKGVECILEPGTWLYIPAGWLHYVETLDNETCSLIIRLHL